MSFIQDNRNHYTVSQLCSALKFPRSTYYKALVCVPSKRQEEYEEFGRKVKQAYDDSKQRYGSVKICRILNDNGTPCSIKRVQRHMAEQGLRSVVVKKYNHHANYGTVPDDKVNILKGDFEAESINQKWCTDITYIHVLKEGWTYLASVMDLCSRKIIGYAYGTSVTAELAVEAVKNACIESFHSVMKKEEIYLHTYQDSQEARRAIFEYIEGWYNRKRIHSAIGYMTPQQKEEEELRKAAYTFNFLCPKY